MPIAEQLLYGHETQTSERYTVLAQTPGLGKDVAGEIRQLCEGWGQVPVGGLAREVLLSIPLKKTMSSLRGRLFAVVQLSPGHRPLFHAAVLNETDYSAFGHNPFAVQQAFPFLTEWRQGVILDQQDFEPVPDAGLVDPPPSRADMPLVGESLRHILMKKNLHLPLGQPEAEGDRILALLVASLPTPLRKDLRFASFAGSERNAFLIAGMSTPNCAFSGWQRLLLTQVAGIVPDDVEQYVGAVGSYLAAGDLPGLCRLAREQHTVPGGTSESATGFARRTPRTAVEPPRTAAPRTRSIGLKSPATPMRAMESPFTIRTNDDHGPKRRPRPRKARLSPAYRTLGGTALTRPGTNRILPLLTVGLAVAGLLWWRMPDVERFVGEKFGWTRTTAEERQDDRLTTLLSVVDVGDIYGGLLRRYVRAGLAAGDDAERGRREALLTLQADAAGPLLEQLDIFVDLANQGIQQVGRPDREEERLRFLARQGVLLEQEMHRLELAWHSLDTGTDWRDLSDLDDGAVSARRDSLHRVAPAVLRECGRQLGTTEARRIISTAQRRVAGMSELMGLMHVDTWSREWEDQVEAAAELVSPRASAATRAYRNSAFAFVRLKRAERSTAARALPFSTEFRDGAWPSRAVRDILPELRNETARFGRGKVPKMLAETLELYASLERCATLARDAAADGILDDLAGNAAVRFDPVTYENYIERIRFEAARGLLDTNGDSTGIPSHLYSGADSLAVDRFVAILSDSPGAATWSREHALQQQPFLARWAQYNAEQALREEMTLQQEFDVAWQTCTRHLAAVRQRTAAGSDWTGVWLDLHEQLTLVLDTYARRLDGDRVRAARLQQAAALAAALEAPRTLVLKSATVRLPAEALLGEAELVVELDLPDGEVLRSDALRLGPAAPASAGWVGTVDLGWELTVGPADDLSARVIDPREGIVVFETRYDSLQDRVGPGALGRPRGEDAGTLAIQVASSWWRGLVLPDLE